MKRLLALMLCAVSLGVIGQTTIVLTVDMSNETVSADGVHVAGNFQGWEPGSTPMIDNGDGTWTHTFTSDTAATYQYKFINGNAWGPDEYISAACAVDGNRQIEVDGLMGDIEFTTCFGRCVACDQSAVLFRVDMSNEEVSPYGVHVAGDFQGWDPGATQMTDADGDMVYEYIHAFEPDVTVVEYKFINGNSWTDPVEILDGDCSNGVGCRILELDSDPNLVLSANSYGDAYCFSQCYSCVLPVAVTFTVDMSIAPEVSEEGVHIAGTFQGWDAESTMLTDNGDGTWSITLEVAPGPHEFRFINGAGWNGGEENMNGTSCNAGGNRGAEFDAENNTYEACFNVCPGESCLPDPDPANLTFQVDASEVDMGEEAMYIFGAFTGWQGGAIEMTDNGDGTWQTTQLVSGSVNVDYKYSIGAPTNDGNDESGSYVLAGDSTTFEMEGCGVGNGFGGYNRRFVRSGMDEVIPLHCYNSCGACLGDGGCLDSEACNYDETAMTNNGSCIYPGDVCDDFDDMTVNDVVDSSCDCIGEAIVAGCTDDFACNYDFNANVDDGSCTYIGDYCDDGDDSTHSNVLNVDCICVGGFPIIGCTNPDACNWVQGAYIDDGSCLFGYDALWVCGGDCEEDSDGDGVCDAAEILGCTYDFAANFNPLATVDDGSCTLDEPGNSGCELVYDGNGDGLVGSGDLLGLLTEFGAQCVDETFFSCGDPVNYQGYDYATVQIGEQCWFAENLRAENYRNGDAIPSGLDGSSWAAANYGAVSVYGEDTSECIGINQDSTAFVEDALSCDEAWSLAAYGRMYNWYAVSDERSICPSGWEVPSVSEWDVTISSLGGALVAGEFMKATQGWLNGNNGNNQSGFNGLPGGQKNFSTGNFSSAGSSGLWWSSSTDFRCFYMGTQDGSISNYFGYPNNGYSVRCIKDSE